MWRTLPPFELQTVFWGPYFPQRTACLFSHGEIVCVITSLINIKILSLNSSSKNTHLNKLCSTHHQHLMIHLQILFSPAEQCGQRKASGKVKNRGALPLIAEDKLRANTKMERMCLKTKPSGGARDLVVTLLCGY